MCLSYPLPAARIQPLFSEYPYFNVVQSTVFDSVFGSGESPAYYELHARYSVKLDIVLPSPGLEESFSGQSHNLLNKYF